MSGYRIIHVEFIYPPIPVRSFDYQATFDGYDAGDPIGHGPTEQAAIDDLHEAAEAQAEYMAERRCVASVALVRGAWWQNPDPWGPE